MTSPLDIKETKDIKVEVSEFQGKQRVDIRRWYQDKKTGEWGRTGKGLNMSVEEFEALVEQMKDICSYVIEETHK